MTSAGYPFRDQSDIIYPCKTYTKRSYGKPQMLEKATSVQSMLSSPFYEYFNQSYKSRRTSFDDVKGFINLFLTRILSENTDSWSTQGWTDIPYRGKDNQGSPCLIDVSTENENHGDKEIKYERRTREKFDKDLNINLVTKIGSDSDQNLGITSTRPGLLIDHYAEKLCLLIFNKEIKCTAKRQTRKFLKENKIYFHRKKIAENVVSRHKDYSNEVVSLFSVEEQLTSSLKSQSIIVDVDLNDNQGQSSEEGEPEFAIQSLPENLSQHKAIPPPKKVKNINYLRSVHRIDRLKNEDFPYGRYKIFKKLFFRKRCNRGVTKEASNRILYKNKIMSQALQSKCNRSFISQQAEYAQIMDAFQSKYTPVIDGNVKEPEFLEEVSVELL